MVDIRKLKDDDKSQVRTLELFCIREYLEGSLQKSWDDLPAELMEQLGASTKDSYDFYRDGGMSYVAVEKGQVVGFLFSRSSSTSTTSRRCFGSRTWECTRNTAARASD